MRKLVTYRIEAGIRHGVIRGAAGAETLVDLGSGDLLALLEAGPEGIARARSASGPE
jgi:hypothetical protein